MNLAISGLVALAIISGLYVVFLLVFAVLFLIIPVIKGAPYVPTKHELVAAMIKLSRIKPGEKMADLGSGNGRILIAFAKIGVEAHGYEINPLLAWRSRHNIKRANLENIAFVHTGSFWGHNLSNFDCITVYGLNHIMKPLEKKLLKELRPGARVLSNAFQFPNWQPAQEIKSIRLYEK